MSPRKMTVPAVLIVLSISLACSTFSSAPATPTPQPAIEITPAAVVAVALRLDGGSPQLSSFVGPAAQAWALPAGLYLVSAVDQYGRTLSFAEVEVTDRHFAWPADFESAGAGADPELAAAIQVLAGFLMRAESAKLSALESSSAGFSAPLFSTDPGQAELDALYVRYGLIAAQETPVLAALEAVLLDSVSGTARRAAPRRDLKDALLGFFGYAGDAGARARERILKITFELSLQEEADAFNAVREGFRAGATNFNELLRKLEAGELDTQAAQIESDMRNAPGFAAQAVAAGESVGQIVHREGAELVTKGAELQAEVIQGVLGDVFPDISEGFDLADKANEWAEYVHAVYQDPLAAAEGEARGALQEQIKERILSDLGSCCAALGEELAGEIADKVSEEAVAAIPEIVPALRATQTAAAAPPAPVTATVPPAAPPLVDLRATLFESVTDGTAENFSTALVLTADFETGTVIGSLEGVSTREVIFDCWNSQNPSEIWDHATVLYGFTYAADVDGVLDLVTGEFSAAIAPSGYTDFDLTVPFTDERCLSLNSEPAPDIGPFSGSGAIYGVVSPDGGAVVNTDWQAGRAHVAGSWSGQGQVTP